MPTIHHGGQELITPAEFADEIGVHRRTVVRWVARGWIPGYRLPSGRLLLDRRDLDLAARRVRPGEVWP